MRRRTAPTRSLRQTNLSAEPRLFSIRKHYAEVFIIGSLDLLILVTLSPFGWLSLPIQITTATIATWYCLKLLKPKRQGRFSLPRLGFAMGLAAVTLCLVATCPLLLASKPIYLSALESNDPLKSEIRPLHSNGRNIGSLMLITDPVRKALISLSRHHLPSTVRVLDQTAFANGSYYTLPILEYFLMDSRSPGEITGQRSIYFPLNIALCALNIELPETSLLTLRANELQLPAKKHSLWFGFQGVEQNSLLDFYYTQYPDTVPWNAVEAPSLTDTTRQIYVAYLDRTLDCFVLGETEKALNSLEAAVAVVPSSTLEAARLAALQYIVTRGRLYGNLGRLQSLPLLHRAYDLFLLSTEDRRFSARDPLTGWLRSTLLQGYSEWSSAFLDRTSRLSAIPHTADKAESAFTALRSRLSRSSYEELFHIVESEELSSPQLFFAKAHVVNRAFTQIIQLGNNGAPTDKRTAKELAAGVRLVASRALPIIQHIDLRLSKHLGPQPDPLALREFEQIYTYAPVLAEHWDDSNENFRRYLLATFPKSDTLRCLIMEFESKRGNRSKFEELGEQVAAQWWTEDYLLWFMSWSVDAFASIDRHRYPKPTDEFPIETDMRAKISKPGPDHFTKDMAGRGRTFLPGLACLAWYAQTFDIQGKDSLKREFEEKTLLSLDAYIASLEPAHAL